MIDLSFIMYIVENNYLDLACCSCSIMLLQKGADINVTAFYTDTPPDSNKDGQDGDDDDDDGISSDSCDDSDKEKGKKTSIDVEKENEDSEDEEIRKKDPSWIWKPMQKPQPSSRECPLFEVRVT